MATLFLSNSNVFAIHWHNAYAPTSITEWTLLDLQILEKLLEWRCCRAFCPVSHRDMSLIATATVYVKYNTSAASLQRCVLLETSQALLQGNSQSDKYEIRIHSTSYAIYRFVWIMITMKLVVALVYHIYSVCIKGKNHNGVNGDGTC